MSVEIEGRQLTRPEAVLFSAELLIDHSEKGDGFITVHSGDYEFGFESYRGESHDVKKRRMAESAAQCVAESLEGYEDRNILALYLLEHDLLDSSGTHDLVLTFRARVIYI